MSRYCQRCVQIEKCKNDSTKYEALKSEHQPVCKINHHGSAPSMEAAGAKQIWEKSWHQNKLCHTEFYVDGDSKSFPAVEHTYPGKKVVKKEWIGHVQKRVGTRLRNLKKNVKDLGGKGKLTEVMIDRLQNYYGIAIRNNCNNLDSMKKAIHAGFFHVISTEKDNYHDHCPRGKDSWCTHKVDQAEGTNKYKPGKGLPINIIKHIKPIFQDLSTDDLLSKCLHGKTQNQNEALNGMIWNRLPKSRYVGLTQFGIGVYDAVAHYNIGGKATIDIYFKLGIEPGKLTMKGCSSINAADRLKNAEKKDSTKNKERRRYLRGKHKQSGDKIKHKEGKTYGAGSF